MPNITYKVEIDVTEEQFKLIKDIGIGTEMKLVSQQVLFRALNKAVS